MRNDFKFFDLRNDRRMGLSSRRNKKWALCIFPSHIDSICTIFICINTSVTNYCFSGCNEIVVFYYARTVSYPIFYFLYPIILEFIRIERQGINVLKRDCLLPVNIRFTVWPSLPDAYVYKSRKRKGQAYPAPAGASN